MGPISSSHVSIFIGVLGLDGDSSLVPKVEVAPKKGYEVSMKTWPHEAFVPCASKVISNSSNKPKTLDAKNAFDLYFSHSKHWTLMASITFSLHVKSHCWWGCFTYLGLLNVTSWLHCHPCMNMPFLWWNPRGDIDEEYGVGGWDLNNWCFSINVKIIT